MAQPSDPNRMPVHPVFRKSPPHPALDYRPPRALRLIRLATISFISCASLAILYVSWWFFLATSLQDGAKDWIQTWTDSGLNIQYTRMEVDGFPFTLRLTVTTPSLSRGDDGAAWSASVLVAETTPLPFSNVTIRTTGRQNLVLPLDQGPTPFVGHAGLIELSTDSLSDTPRMLTLTLREVQLESPSGSVMAATFANVHLRRLSPEKIDHKTITGNAIIKAHGIRFPNEAALPLGERLQSLNLNARLLGEMTDAPLNAALRQWRDDGGTVEIDTLSLLYGPMTLNTSGTLALDGDRQPVGAGTAKIQGFFKTVDALRARGLINAKAALTAKLILGALSRKAPNGGGPMLTIPISIQKKTLFIGPVPLLDMPDMPWPEDKNTPAS